MPVLFTPTVMGQLIHALAPAFSGQQAQKGKSVLAGRLDTAVASSRFTLTDDGSLKGGLGSSRSDAEGVPTQKKVLVENGVLKGFLHNTYSANRDKTRSTGNAVRTSFKGLPDVGITNLIIRPGASSSEAIIGRLSRALQVENAMGMHTVDPISGDFSLSVDGHLIENGKRTHPVRQVTIAGNMIDLLGSIDAIGNDLIFKGSIGAPSVLVRAMMVSGK
jgi:PmbA protein